MEKTHKEALESLCRICASAFPRDRPSNHKKAAKYLCGDFKDDIENFFHIPILLENDPKHICLNCLSYMRDMKKNGYIGKKFVKRLWQQECGYQCDTCTIFTAKRSGRPPKSTFKTSFTPEKDPHANRIVPLTLQVLGGGPNGPPPIHF